MEIEKIIGLILITIALVSLIVLLYITCLQTVKTEKENKLLINKKLKLEIKKLEKDLE